MQQDVFSPKFCVEGMPDWIVNIGTKILIDWLIDLIIEFKTGFITILNISLAQTSFSKILIINFDIKTYLFF